MPDVQFAFLNGISYIGSIIVDDGLESLIFRVMYNFHYLIVFTKIENIFLLEDEELIEKYEESNYKKRIEGNIYIGKVQNTIPGLQAAFINVGENKNAFIHLKDILPKNDSRIDNELNNIENYNIKEYVKNGIYKYFKIHSKNKKNNV